MDEKGLITLGTLSDVGDAIREQLDTDTQYLPSEMPAAIRSIQGKVTSVNGQTGDVELDAADVGALSPADVDAALSGTSENPVQNKAVFVAVKNRIATYDGDDLRQVFGSAEAFHNAIAAGDFSRIHIGDYYPITLSGTFHDAASNTDKTLNALVKMEVATINAYLHMGDMDFPVPHILLCSRDCLPPALQYRSANDVWYDTTQVNPWRGSALWDTLNNSDSGIIKLVEATDLGSYIFKGPNNKGMRAYLETMAEGAAAPTTGAWADRGRLFLPEEMEVYGSKIRSPKSNAIADMLYNQWPIFAGSGRHIIKGAGDGGGRSGWWLETAYSATNFCLVSYNGNASSYSAASTSTRVPLCFLMV